jgi:hypothetical protein
MNSYNTQIRVQTKFPRNAVMTIVLEKFSKAFERAYTFFPDYFQDVSSNAKKESLIKLTIDNAINDSALTVEALIKLLNIVSN